MRDRVLGTVHKTVVCWALTEFDRAVLLGVSTFSMSTHSFIAFDSEGLFNMVIAHVCQKSGSFSPDVKLYIQHRSAQESWNFIKFIHRLLSQFPVPTVLNFVGHIPTQSSGPSVECYYGWKLATLVLWRSLDDLGDGLSSFKEAFDHLQTSGNDASDSEVGL
ncbi:hypothetical protein L208DRAFT_454931 [Tricholoma matsutake]|nr:hypothetical protein L208DRAFT_454931 [Tricholoma matsutake 945]